MFTFGIKKPMNWFRCVAVLVVSLFIGCSGNKTTKEISDEVVLKIGNAEITKYEFERNKKRTYQTGGNQSYNQWINNLINETYLLADALDKRYDTISVINKQVNYASYSMVGQVEGYLWEKTVTPLLKFSSTELRKAYKKRNKSYHIEFLLFADINLANRMIKNDKEISETLFRDLVKLKDTNQLVKFYQLEYLYPFENLAVFKDEIYNLKPGQIVRCNTRNQSYVIHLTNIEDKQQPSFAAETSRLQELLKQATEIQVIEQKQHEVYNKANIEYHAKVMDEFFELLKTADGKVLAKAPENPYDTLITYIFNNKRVPLLVSQFLEMYLYNQTLYVIKEEEQLKQLLDESVLELYLFAEAESIGVTKEKQYLLDKRNYRNRLIIDSYLQSELTQKIEVTDKEKLGYFNQHSQDYAESVTSYVTVFTFSSLDAVYNNYHVIKKKLETDSLNYLADTQKMPGLLNVQFNMPVTRKDSNFHSEVVNQFFGSPLKQLSKPVNTNGGYIIFIKTREEGLRLKSFQEVKENIFWTIHNKKFDEIKNERLQKLKNKYSVAVKKI